MEELTIEEKAKRYDKAIERATNIYTGKYKPEKAAIVAEILEDVFPELIKESDDERIGKVIYGLVYTQPSQFFDSGFSKEEILDWIEKQEKFYKIKPRFKVGDLIILAENHNSVYQVERIDNYRYYLRHYLGGTLSVHFDNELIRLWTIEDAKKGDILEFVDHGRLVVGIVSFVNERTGKVDVSCLLEDNKFKIGNFYALDTINPHPATKEQRDILMKAMADAGYTFDFKKKELRKLNYKED